MEENIDRTVDSFFGDEEHTREVMFENFQFEICFIKIFSMRNQNPLWFKLNHFIRTFQKENTEPIESARSLDSEHSQKSSPRSSRSSSSSSRSSKSSRSSRSSSRSSGLVCEFKNTLSKTFLHRISNYPSKVTDIALNQKKLESILVFHFSNQQIVSSGSKSSRSASPGVSDHSSSGASTARSASSTVPNLAENGESIFRLTFV